MIHINNQYRTTTGLLGSNSEQSLTKFDGVKTFAGAKPFDNHLQMV